MHASQHAPPRPRQATTGAVHAPPSQPTAPLPPCPSCAARFGLPLPACLPACPPQNGLGVNTSDPNYRFPTAAELQVVYMVFDVLYYEDRSVINLTLEVRWARGGEGTCM